MSTGESVQIDTLSSLVVSLGQMLLEAGMQSLWIISCPRSIAGHILNALAILIQICGQAEGLGTAVIRRGFLCVLNEGRSELAERDSRTVGRPLRC